MHHMAHRANANSTKGWPPFCRRALATGLETTRESTRESSLTVSLTSEACRQINNETCHREEILEFIKHLQRAHRQGERQGDVLQPGEGDRVVFYNQERLGGGDSLLLEPRNTFSAPLRQAFERDA